MKFSNVICAALSILLLRTKIWPGEIIIGLLKWWDPPQPLLWTRGGGGGVKYKTVSIGNHNFSNMCILNKDFFHAKMTPFSQNLTPKWGFVQNLTLKSDRILKKYSILGGGTLIPCVLSHAYLQYYTWLPPPWGCGLEISFIAAPLLLTFCEMRYKSYTTLICKTSI